MYKVYISIFSVFSASLLFILHKLASNNHWYMQYWFADIFMHFWGGLCIALLLHCLDVFFRIKFIKSQFWNIIIGVISIGIAWEIFEYAYDITGFPTDLIQYKLDTIKDLIMDTLGAISIYLLIFKKK